MKCIRVSALHMFPQQFKKMMAIELNCFLNENRPIVCMGEQMCEGIEKDSGNHEWIESIWINQKFNEIDSLRWWNSNQTRIHTHTRTHDKRAHISTDWDGNETRWLTQIEKEEKVKLNVFESSEWKEESWKKHISSKKFSSSFQHMNVLGLNLDLKKKKTKKQFEKIQNENNTLMIKTLKTIETTSMHQMRNVWMNFDDWPPKLK